MNTDDVDSALEEILLDGKAERCCTDPRFVTLIQKVHDGKLSVDDAMKIARQQRNQ